MSSGLYNEGLFREGLLRTTNLVRPGLITQFDTLEEALTRFAVNGVEAALALDFIGSEYRTGNAETTFADAFMGNSPKLTYNPGSASTSQSTMVNSSGNIVWAPHNLALNSAAPATQTITVVSGADYTVRVTGTGSMTLSGAGTGTATDGSPATITASTTSLTIALTGSLGTVAVYRSDLGGMAPVPGAATGLETYVPTNGAAEYLPRVGHHVFNGSTWVNEGLLIESEPRTNLVTHSVPDNTNWTVTGLTLDDTTGYLAPDGTQGAVKLTSSGSGTNRIRFLTSLSGVNSYSFYAKAGTGSYVQILDGSSGNYYANFDLSLGSEGTKGNLVTSLIEDVGSSWYRCTMVTDGSVAGVHFNVYIVDSASAYYGASSTSADTVYIWGFQLEAAPTPSSYIPTNGSTVIRGAQSLTVPPAEFGWNTDAVSIQMDGRMTYADTDVVTEAVPWYWDAGGTNRIFTRLNTSGGTGKMSWIQGAAYEETGGSQFSPGINVPFNIASRHGSTFIDAAVDGVALTGGTTPTALPDLSNTDLEIAQDFMGTIGTFRQFAGDIGDTGLVTATNPSTEPTLSLTFDGTGGSFYNLSWSE